MLPLRNAEPLAIEDRARLALMDVEMAVHPRGLQMLPPPIGARTTIHIVRSMACVYVSFY